MLAFRISILVGLIQLAPGVSALADRIVLRNLEVIDNKAVVSVDEDGARLDDGTLLSWDRIEKGRVAENLQSRFDQLLAELGPHLYRIRQRLSVGDYRGVLSDAEAVQTRYVDRPGDTAYMVLQALMWARLAAGEREAALSPFLRCYAKLRAAQANGKPLELPGERHLQVDMATGFTPELIPIWFDDEAARQALPEVTAAVAAMQRPYPPGIRVYYATLALAAGELSKAEQALAGLEGPSPMRGVVEAQAQLLRGKAEEAIQALTALLSAAGPELQPVALYWLGRAQLATGDPRVEQQGLLDLLKLPALYGQQEPDLAAAGLYITMQSLAAAGDSTGSIAVRRELLDRYGQTWHARKLRAEDEKAK